MNNRNDAGYHWVLASAVLLYLAELVAAQPVDYPIEKVMKDWGARQAQAISVHYEAKGDLLYVKGAYTENLKSFGQTGVFPEQDRRFPKKEQWLLHFKNNWARKEVQESILLIAKRDFAPMYYGAFYNGKTLKKYTPREKNTSEFHKPVEFQPDLTIEEKGAQAVFFLVPDYPLFLAHGYVPTVTRSPSLADMSMPLNINDFAVHGRGELDGRQCIILKSAKKTDHRVDEYWVDAGRQHVIVRWSRFTDGSVDGPIWARVDIRYRELNSGWMPEGWTITHYAREEPNQVVTMEKMTVTAFELNPSLEIQQFEVQATAGSIVSIARDSHSYRVREDGTLQDADTPTNRWGWTIFLLGSIILAAGVVLALRYYRCRLRGRPSPTQ